MTKYVYYEFTEKGDCTIIKTQEDIKKEYYPHWKEKLAKKFEQSYDETNVSFQDCLNDWISVNWATELED